MLERLLRRDAGKLVERSWRNGPPEAVSQMVLTSSCAPTRRHWWTALCSLSMGRIGTLRSRAARGKNFARGDHALLVGQAHGFSGQDAACVASSPATPTIAETTKSASGSVEQATVPAVPWTTSMPVTPACAEPRSQLRPRALRWPSKPARTPADGLREGFVDVAAGGQRGDGVALRKLLNDGECALADGAGGTENGETFQKTAPCS